MPDSTWRGAVYVEKKRKRVSLSVSLNVLVIVIILALSTGLTLIAYRVNSERVDRYYKITTAHYADTVAAFMDGDWFERFLGMINTEEYRALRERAVAEQNEQLVKDWLVEKDMLADYEKACAALLDFRDRMDAKYIYTLTVEGSDSINIIDPDEGFLYTGSTTPSPQEFMAYKENGRIEPTVSVTAYGWLCSAYDPIVNAKGENVALVGVDIDMTEVMAERQEFLYRMIIFALILLVLSVGACILQMQKLAIKPLQMLSEATRGFTEHKNGYTKDDIISLPITDNNEIGDLYHVIRNMQGKIVEYLDNLTRVTAEKERIGAELNIATQIQADMLPRIFPAFPARHDFDIYATMTPAKEVGGDFYDFFLIDDDHMGLVMADVSGKGVPAALFMVIAKTLIKNRAMMGGGPAEILKYVNEQLCEGNEAELFVTVWLAIVELSTGKGLAANAGHEHPAIRRANGEYELVVYRHSPAVATMDGIRFREHSFQLNPGDALFVYTDGVTEATNANNELFGTDRMLEALNRAPRAKPNVLLTNVKTAIDSFVGEAPQFDDITMMCFDYTAAEVKNVKELTVEAKLENLDEVLGFVDGCLEEMDCSMKTQLQIDVAVEEIFVNIASYAYPSGIGSATIRVEAMEDPRTAAITFYDHGIPYNPLEKEDPDVTLSAEERKIGGLGIFMVKKSMDDMRYEYRDGMNILQITKQL